MTTVLLLRHGHVAGIVPKRFRGRMDLPLSEEGREQAERAAQYVTARYRLDAVYCSPLQRCVDSAAALTRRARLPSPRPCAALTDTDYGRWQGSLASEVAVQDAELYERWQETPHTVTFPGGETLAGVAERTTREIATLVERHPAGTIAVFSHDSVIRCLLLELLGASLAQYHRLEVDPCSLSELRYEARDAEIVRVNERTGQTG